MHFFQKLPVILCAFWMFATIAIAQHPNVLIGDVDSPNEPAICIHPKNTNEIVAAAGLNQVFFSHDGGQNWQQAPVSCPWGIWSDPAIGVDTTGAFYFWHLSNPAGGDTWIDRIICQKSVDDGQSWTDGAYVGLNGLKDQDKEWCATDWRTNRLYVSWTQFDKYGSSNPLDSAIVLFSHSTDGGLSWADPLRINREAGDCLDRDNTPEGAVPCVTPDGTVCVAWAFREKIWFDRSTDGGLNWLPEDIEVGDQPGGWDFAIPALNRSNGLPVLQCDNSQGPYRGTLYVNWTDQRNGDWDTDVWLAKSTDGGDTWSAPVRVNDDPPGKQQFFTWMAVDQATGWLWFVFYDRRNYSDEQTDVYMAVSRDGGETFQNFKVSESPFLPQSDIFFGDYTNITAHNQVVRPIWGRMHEGHQSIWTALVDPLELSPVSEPGSESLFIASEPAPQPAARRSFLSFKLRRPALVNLSIWDLQGRLRARPVHRQWRAGGKYSEPVDAGVLGLEPGVYLAVLEVDGQVVTRKMVFSGESGR